MGGDEACALAAVGMMVGTLALARVVTDPQRSQAILRAAHDHALSLAGEAGLAARAPTRHGA
ncbi:MAG TPA: hypothetical protein VKG05_13285 [Steroidobacteraceae bacterium]|nr:hypothetical protein [Steroidobacteraceae bacterium]